LYVGAYDYALNAVVVRLLVIVCVYAVWRIGLKSGFRQFFYIPTMKNKNIFIGNLAETSKIGLAGIFAGIFCVLFAIIYTLFHYATKK